MSESLDDLLDLEQALERLAEAEPDKARLVRLRVFAGRSVAKAAFVLGISVATAEHWWAFARAWLYSELKSNEEKFTE